MNAIIIQRIFTKYRRDILDELHKKIDFVLLHSVNKSGISQSNATYAQKICSFQYAKKESNVFLNVFPYLLKNRPKIIIHEFSIGIASLIPTYLLARLLKMKFILWGHGYDRTKGFYPEKSYGDKLRLWLMRKADAVIFYGSDAKLHLSKLINSEKLFIAYNCLNTNSLDSIRNVLEKEGRETVKERIGLKHKYNLIYIGRLLVSKQPDILITVFEHLKNSFGNTICLNFVGDGEYMSDLKAIVKSKGLEDSICFYGALHDDHKTGELLFCSDLMVMPGLVGLSVNHAFNFDCPVVTYQQLGHGPEIEYIENEKTGFVVETRTTDEMALIISRYLLDTYWQAQMKINIRTMINNICNLNNFIKGFEDAIEFVEKAK